MISRSLSRLPSQCFYKTCPSKMNQAGKGDDSPIFGRIVRKGSYFRSSDSRRIHRFHCLVCQKTFSQASSSRCFGQKKRRLNQKVGMLLDSGVSQREAAKFLRTTRTTIVRKFLFLGKKALEKQTRFLQQATTKDGLFENIQFDEMETFEHSKCLPLSIPLVVENGTQKILGFRVCSMPAKGHLAQISRQKYGPRSDHRAASASELFSELKEFISPTAIIKSDENPKYPSWIRSQFPDARHLTYKGRRGCVVGQGELKRGGFDPLFSLNHTAAMLRANINRLFRRTWCTTKQRERLALHIALYVEKHNRRMTLKVERKKKTLLSLPA